jgi:hypothetical protein
VLIKEVKLNLKEKRMTISVAVAVEDILEEAGARLGQWVFRLYDADGVEVASALSTTPETTFDYVGGQGHTATAERWTEGGKLHGNVVVASVDGVALATVAESSAESLAVAVDVAESDEADVAEAAGHQSEVAEPAPEQVQTETTTEESEQAAPADTNT